MFLIGKYLNLFDFFEGFCSKFGGAYFEISPSCWQLAYSQRLPCYQETQASYCLNMPNQKSNYEFNNVPKAEQVARVPKSTMRGTTQPVVSWDRSQNLMMLPNGYPAGLLQRRADLRQLVPARIRVLQESGQGSLHAHGRSLQGW